MGSPSEWKIINCTAWRGNRGERLRKMDKQALNLAPMSSSAHVVIVLFPLLLNHRMDQNSKAGAAENCSSVRPGFITPFSQYGPPPHHPPWPLWHA